MFYLVWIVSAFVAVGIGCFVAGKMDKRED
ncbi:MULTISPECIES: cytochrome bd oxidase small subunit, CydX/CbdX family [unclassified Francisella]|jgi:hypothetical protein|nr:cytochrome bd oxidase small subunit, CydX/CbdX family [Francisella sp. LA112445]QIW09318.1 cytochrome bd oxidase small subunit, CydX/CbdX family [Francisella sp. LA112445]